ncbi:MAG TPA: IclR family transcriptional regulator [Solirubrobacteraceae bacterium]|jgi:IclR family pca regulon transcriptional regulator|nr:IclR family transcriptional regulator [Solirubrobacteraceae bacterium]
MPRIGANPPVPADEWAPAIPTLQEPRFSQSLERGLAILGCFTPARPVLGIADLADELGMSRSTTHRYVITLTRLGYLEQGVKRKYRLTLRVTDLGISAMNGMSLYEHAHAYLEELRARTGFTASMGVVDGGELLLVDWLRGGRRGQRMIDLELAPGSRLPLYATAAGKLLLANLPEQDQRERIAALQMAKHTPNTIKSKTALRQELRRIGDDNLATAEEELAAGLYEIAAPVRASGGDVVAAAAIAAHSSMISLEELVDALGPHLISTADRVSARLGYRREDERVGG